MVVETGHTISMILAERVAAEERLQSKAGKGGDVVLLAAHQLHFDQA
jgi:hypothetical protein